MTLAVFFLACAALVCTLVALSKGTSPLGVAVLLLCMGELLLTWSAHGALR